MEMAGWKYVSGQVDAGFLFRLPVNLEPDVGLRRNQQSLVVVCLVVRCFFVCSLVWFGLVRFGGSARLDWFRPFCFLSRFSLLALVACSFSFVCLFACLLACFFCLFVCFFVSSILSFLPCLLSCCPSFFLLFSLSLSFSLLWQAGAGQDAGGMRGAACAAGLLGQAIKGLHKLSKGEVECSDIVFFASGQFGQTRWRRLLFWSWDFVSIQDEDNLFHFLGRGNVLRLTQASSGKT